MDIEYLIQSWIMDEIEVQKKEISKLGRSDYGRITGFNEFLEMRKLFLAIAEYKLKMVESLHKTK